MAARMLSFCVVLALTIMNNNSAEECIDAAWTGFLISTDTEVAYLHSGESLISSQNQYALTMFQNGSLVLRNMNTGARTWYMDTNVEGAYLALGTDRNLAIYSPTDHVILWQTSTSSATATGATLQLDDRGKLSLYDTESNTLWTRTYRTSITWFDDSFVIMKDQESIYSEDEHYFFVQQGDGNAVVYQVNPYDDSLTAIWNAGTGGKYDAVFAAQGDGNLVIYFQNTAIWNIGHSNSQKNKYSLVMQEDGNLVYYDCNGNWIWASYQNALNPDYVVTACNAHDLIHANESLTVCETTPSPTTGPYAPNKETSEGVCIFLGIVLSCVCLMGMCCCFVLIRLKCMKHRNTPIRINYLLLVNANEEGH